MVAYADQFDCFGAHAITTAAKFQKETSNANRPPMNSDKSRINNKWVLGVHLRLSAPNVVFPERNGNEILPGQDRP
jgi:hypothetical protein